MKIDENWCKLSEIDENWWKVMKIDGSCWKFTKIDENLDEKFSRPESCSKFSNRFFELFTPGKIYKKDSKEYLEMKDRIINVGEYDN